MAMPDFGPVGGGVAAITGTSPAVIETQSNHGLADGDRIRIQSGQANGAPLLAYVKCSGYPNNAFVAYGDPALKAVAVINSVGPGTSVIRLAAEDWAVIAGINYYPAYSSLNGPVKDATLFANWLRSDACVPDDQVSLIVSPKNAPTTVADAAPTLDKVKGAFEALAGRAYAKDLNHLGRRLYIFLSGHGILPTRSGTPSFNETALLM